MPNAHIIGSGPNGLSAANRLADAGWEVTVFEASSDVGGGTRSAELTQPGFIHDICAAIHPTGLASPYFSTLGLDQFGLEWLHPKVPQAHPFLDGTAVALHRSIDETASQFSSSSEAAYRRLFTPLAENASDLLTDLMAPPKFPKHPLRDFQFGIRVLTSAESAARRLFDDEKARALLAGNAAHSVLPLDRFLTTQAIALMLMMLGHSHGWPVAKGGSQAIARALKRRLESLGGTVRLNERVDSIDELEPADAIVFDTRPAAMASIAGEHLPLRYRKRLNRFRHGPGVFKIDYALSEPIPWTSQLCAEAGTVHLGASLEEIVESESAMWHSRHPERPFVLCAQQSEADPSRAPEGKATFWAYCHVPAGSTVDMTDPIEAQIERFAPGFRDCVEARHTMNCEDFESYNPNYVGGDIVGGVADWRQLLTRPVVRLRPHTTPNPKLFLCSASTPPGGGVHGMGGYWAAEAVLADSR
ncbi:MAG: NAD(P)/FAD-dependent oxidoreductase [Verrucomicrobiota bacterium]